MGPAPGRENGVVETERRAGIRGRMVAARTRGLRERREKRVANLLRNFEAYTKKCRSSCAACMLQSGTAVPNKSGRGGGKHV